MKKLLIIAIVSVAVAFGRHVSVQSPDSHEAPDESSYPDHPDEALRKELDEMLVQEINSATKKDNIGEYKFYLL